MSTTRIFEGQLRLQVLRQARLSRTKRLQEWLSIWVCADQHRVRPSK